MSRFLTLAIFATVATGVILHFGVELPSYLHWIGKLPGDIVIKKGGLTLYVPATTSVSFSLALTIILGLFSRKAS